MLDLATPLVAIVGLLETGGPVMVLIAFNGAAIGAIFVDRLLVIGFGRGRRERAVLESAELVRALPPRLARHVWELRGSQLAVQLNRPLSMLRSLVALSPLLGLLGTVSGMIEVFDVLAREGTGESRALATGISRAIVPTTTGMCLFVPGLIAHLYVRAAIGRELERLTHLARTA